MLPVRRAHALAPLLLPVALAVACSSDPSGGAAAGGAPGPTEGRAANADAVPRNLRAVAYTFEEVELFWERDGAGRAVAWDVLRDGELVATAPGPSFYESGLRESTGYRYEVVSLDASGAALGSAAVEVRTPADAPVVTRDSAVPLARLALEQLSLAPVGEALVAAGDAYRALFPDAPYAGRRGCPGGGAVLAERDAPEYEVSGGAVRLTFDRCTVDGVEWNGGVSTRQQSFAAWADTAESSRCESAFEDLSRRAPGALPVELDGAFVSVGAPGRDRRFDGRHVERAEAGSLILDGRVDVLDGGSRTEGGFTVQGPLTSNRPLTVALPDPLVAGRYGRAYTGGRLELVDPHGGRLTLRPDGTGPAPGWTVATVAADGEQEREFTAADGTAPGPDPLPRGVECAPLYPPDGLALDGVPPAADTEDPSDPFSASRLPATLDTAFALQRGRAVADALDSIDALERTAIADGWPATTIDPDGALFENTLYTGTYVDEASGEVRDYSHPVYTIEQTDYACPDGGALRVARRAAGQSVDRIRLAEGCAADGARTDASLDDAWQKYSNVSTVRRYVRTDAAGTVEIDGATSSLSGALGTRRTSAERIAASDPSGGGTVATDLVAIHNSLSRADEPLGELAFPAAGFRADVASLDGGGTWTVSSVGDLRLEDEDLNSAQGSIVAESGAGSTLTVAFANGDDDSFDVEVRGADGSGYARRFGYTDARFVRRD